MIPSRCNSSPGPAGFVPVHSPCPASGGSVDFSPMPRKTPVLTIPEKPTGRAKPQPSRVVAKHRPDPGPEQFNLWDAFAASSEQDELVEAAPKRSAKPKRGRSSRAP
jgi:hypothetical protein